MHGADQGTTLRGDQKGHNAWCWAEIGNQLVQVCNISFACSRHRTIAIKAIDTSMRQLRAVSPVVQHARHSPLWRDFQPGVQSVQSN